MTIHPIELGAVGYYIEACKLDGRSIVQAIKGVRDLFGVRLGEAKRLVSEHPAYHLNAQAAEPLHDTAEAVLLAESVRDDLMALAPEARLAFFDALDLCLECGADTKPGPCYCERGYDERGRTNG